jgi:hypothetical protein
LAHAVRAAQARGVAGASASSAFCVYSFPYGAGSITGFAFYGFEPFANLASRCAVACPAEAIWTHGFFTVLTLALLTCAEAGAGYACAGSSACWAKACFTVVADRNQCQAKDLVRGNSALPERAVIVVMFEHRTEFFQEDFGLGEFGVLYFTFIEFEPVKGHSFAFRFIELDCRSVDCRYFDFNFGCWRWRRAWRFLSARKTKSESKQNE